MILVNRTPSEDHNDAVRSTVVHLFIRLLPPVNPSSADHFNEISDLKSPATIKGIEAKTQFDAENRLRFCWLFWEPLEK